MKKYRHLFFDLDNTLWDFDANSKEALKEAFNAVGLMERIANFDDYFEIYEVVNAGYWKLYREGKTNKTTLKTQRFEESLAKYGLPCPGMGEVLHEAYMHEMPKQTKLIDGATELLDKLANRYELYIITNGFKEVQYEKLRRTGLAKYFKKVFISEEVGSQKPGRAIFEYAIKSVNAKKNESIMIGDSWDSDIMGALGFGISYIWFSDSNKYKSIEPPLCGKGGGVAEIIKIEEIPHKNIVSWKKTRLQDFLIVNSLEALTAVF